MYKKLAVLAILFSIGLAMIYANRGNSLTYNSLSFIVSDETFAPQSFMDDLKSFLSSYYSVRVDYSNEGVKKYDWKKFLYFDNDFIVRKSDVYVRVHVYIYQRQPHLLYREKNNDYHIYLDFTRYIHEDENEEDIASFVEDLDNKIELFTKKHNLKSCRK